MDADFRKPLKGLQAFPPDQEPPVAGAAWSHELLECQPCSQFKKKALQAYAYSRGDHTVHLAVHAGGAMGGARLPRYDLFSIGGFLRMSGYQSGELLGESLVFSRAVYMRRFVRDSLFKGLFGGVSLEAGRVNRPVLAGACRWCQRHVDRRIDFSGDRLAGGPGLPGTGACTRRTSGALSVSGRALTIRTCGALWIRPLMQQDNDAVPWQIFASCSVPQPLVKSPSLAMMGFHLAASALT